MNFPLFYQTEPNTVLLLWQPFFNKTKWPGPWVVSKRSMRTAVMFSFVKVNRSKNDRIFTENHVCSEEEWTKNKLFWCRGLHDIDGKLWWLSVWTARANSRASNFTQAGYASSTCASPVKPCFNRGFAQRGMHLYVREFVPLLCLFFVQRGMEKNNNTRC